MCSEIFFIWVGVFFSLDSVLYIVRDDDCRAREARERKGARFDSHVVTFFQRLRALVDTDGFTTDWTGTRSCKPWL